MIRLVRKRSARAGKHAGLFAAVGALAAVAAIGIVVGFVPFDEAATTPEEVLRSALVRAAARNGGFAREARVVSAGGARGGRARSSSSAAVSAESASVPVSKINQLKDIKRKETFNRMGFKDTRKGAEAEMNDEFQSDLIKEMRESMYTLKDGDITFKLAKDFGFCWGVERAVQMAIEAKMHFGDRTIHITNEIIHNPGVNEKMAGMGVKFIPVEDGIKNFDGVDKNDVVILPAFGATLEEMKLLTERGVQIVDTTCPWVSKVWNSVNQHTKKGMTSIIHGTYSHEETIATASFAEDYIIVKTMAEAEYVANYILNGGDKAEFMEKFKNAVSKGFDPDIHLKKLGLANQTTMYKKETRAIGQMMQRTMMQKYGPDKVNEHYMEFDTICDATQERQDAIHELVEDKANPVDMFLVVGGWDSSNTRHLVEIPEMAGIRAYHIDRAERLRPDNSIEYRTVDGKIEVIENFIPKGPVTIGVTSGASTPDAYVEDSLNRIKLIRSSLG